MSRLTSKISSLDMKILMVDDDSFYVKKKIEVLRSYGYEIEGETDARIALEKIKAGNFDLLLLDFIMDSIRGDEVVKAVREFNKELYILLLTGYAEVPGLEIMNNLDITGFCEKTNDNTQLLILLKSAYRSISLMKKVQKYKNMQKNILESVPEIFKLLPISTILEKILEEIIPLVNSNQAFILIDDYLQEGTIYCGLGKYDQYQNIGQELFENIGYTRTQSSLKFINNGLYLPLILQDKSIGVIYVETKDPVDMDDLDILNIYSSLVSSSLSNAILHSMINIKNEELTRTREKLAQWYVEVVESMRETINAKDKYTCGHSDRVTDYSIKIGKELGLSEIELNTLRNGGIFHDIGKIGVPDSILKKEGKLEFNEYKEIQTHPERGAFILSAVSMFKDVVPLVLHHHEKYDGTGYPKKLKGEEIPLMARILSVADALDAMTTDRGYKNKRTLEDAISELEKGAGKQFDSNVVNVCIELIRKNVISIKD